MKKYLFFILFIIIFIATCLFLSLNQEVLATEDWINPLPQEVLDILTNSEYYGDSNYDYISARYLGNPSAYYVIFFQKNVNLKFYIQHNGNDLWLFTNQAFDYYGYDIASDYSINFERWNYNQYPHDFGSGFLINNNEIVNSVPIYQNSNFSDIYYPVNTYTPPSNEEEEEGGILQGIKDFFIGIFIPTETQFQDLQDNFTEKILSKFNIISISRGNVSYDNNDVYESSFNDELPVFNIWGYQFHTSMIYDYMHTPLNFGYLEHWRDNYTQWTESVQTDGITIFDIVNILFGIGITAMNIALYNKFFSKGE